MNQPDPDSGKRLAASRPSRPSTADGMPALDSPSRGSAGGRGVSEREHLAESPGDAGDQGHWPLSRSFPFGDAPPWSHLYACRKEMAALLGKDIFQLPLRRRVRDALLENMADGDRVLEVGAGQRKMGGELLARLPHLKYESMDIDRRLPHDYYALHEAAGPFDAVFSLEVIEHLPLSAIRPWLGELRDRLRPGGRLILSTPNTFYPPAYLRDATHRTPLCYDELAGLANACGFDVAAVYRIYHDPLHRRLLRQYVLGWLFRAIGIDFARQIVLVARKPVAGASRP